MVDKKCPLYDGGRACGCHSLAYFLAIKTIEAHCANDFESCSDYQDYRRAQNSPKSTEPRKCLTVPRAQQIERIFEDLKKQRDNNIHPRFPGAIVHY